MDFHESGEYFPWLVTLLFRDIPPCLPYCGLRLRCARMTIGAGTQRCPGGMSTAQKLITARVSQGVLGNLHNLHGLEQARDPGYADYPTIENASYPSSRQSIHFETMRLAVCIAWHSSISTGSPQTMLKRPIWRIGALTTLI